MSPVRRKQNPDGPVAKRRQIIFWQVVQGNRPLLFSELTRHVGKEYTLDLAKTDIQHFGGMGCRIDSRPSRKKPEEQELYFLDGPHTDADSIREDQNSEEKRCVARMAASVICGIPELEFPFLLASGMGKLQTREQLKELFHDELPADQIVERLQIVLGHLVEKGLNLSGERGLLGKERIKTLLQESNAALGQRKELLINKLSAFWSETNRLIAMDSGTTNIRIAEILREVSLPRAGCQFGSLTVCTNSRRIFEILGPSEVSIKTIIVGGQQKFRSPTIAGSMAEQFLRTATLLQFGMCLLGATKLDLERFVVCSDSQEEASMKMLFMEKSSVRIVCVDNTKLQTGPGREAYKFAVIDPNYVDLIITNSPIKKRNGNKEYADQFVRNVAAIESRGVPVIVASAE